jgi:c-di-GMP-binding flagellar brake protein YcgR
MIALILLNTSRGYFQSTPDLTIPFIIFCLAALIILLLNRILRNRFLKNLKKIALDQIISTNSLQTGDKVKIELLTQSGSSPEEGCIVDIAKKWIGLRVDNPKSFLGVGMPLRVTVIGETSAFCFYEIVKDRKMKDGGMYISLSRPVWMEKVQRREYFRVDLDMPATLSILKPGTDIPHPIRCKLINLSAGGFRVKLGEPAAIGYQARIRLPRTMINGASFEARVVMCKKTSSSDNMDYETHCEFLYIPEETRNLLVQFCFEYQRQFLRRDRKHASY